MRDQTYMTLMRLLPKSALSTAVGMATRAPAPSGIHQWAMRAFAKQFGVSMDEAEHGFEGYSTFAEFFTRRLRPGLRPLAHGDTVIASPVDGAVSQFGYAEAGQCLQAKGIYFPVSKLLGDEAQAREFEGGAFITLYLSPRDYHRIHAPLSGSVLGYRYLPGQFWPVNPTSVRMTDALFAINERLVTYLSTPLGKLALIAVGATCVARIKASYDDVLTHNGGGASARTYETPLAVQKGDELGMFEMGSTVILLFQPGKVRWDPLIQPDVPVRMGMRIGGAP